jgi:predicted kinase
MPKILLISGLPASGKSVFAKQYVKDSGSTVRLNRDLLRLMAFNGEWTGPREGFIKYAERQIAKAAIDLSYSAVIDDTNLGRGDVASWKQLAEECGASFEHKRMDTSVEECLRRDAERENRVGPAVIYRMAVRAGLFKFEPADWPIVLVDLDGTLCEISHRLHYLKECKHCGYPEEAHPVRRGVAYLAGILPVPYDDTPLKAISCPTFAKDWDSFNCACSDDEPQMGVVKWVRALYEDHIVVITSGRSDKYQGQTVEWLKREGVPYHCLLMRSRHDYRPDEEIKLEFLSWLPKERISFVVDDRPRLVKAWRASSLKVYPVTESQEDY